MTGDRLIATDVAALIFVAALALAGCTPASAPPPEGAIIAPPLGYEEMCRERPTLALCPEV